MIEPDLITPDPAPVVDAPVTPGGDGTPDPTPAEPIVTEPDPRESALFEVPVQPSSLINARSRRIE